MPKNHASEGFSSRSSVKLSIGEIFGLEAVKSLKEGGRGPLRRILARILQWGDVPAFFALSIYTDPFITTAYMRKGAFNGMTRRDWRIFLGSWFIGNLGWILVLSGGIALLRFLTR